MHIAIIGSGIIGTLTAYYLAEAGAEITLIDRNLKPGQEASATNACLLCYEYGKPLGSPSLWGELPKALLGLNPDSLFQDWCNPDFWAFSSKLLFKQSSRQRFHENQWELLKLCEQSRQLMEAFISKHPDLNFHHRQNGRLCLFENENTQNVWLHIAKKAQAQNGEPFELLTPEGCHALAPALTNRQGRLFGGIHFTTGADGYAEDLCQNITDHILSHNKNVSVRFNTEVKSLKTSGQKITNIKTNSNETISADHFLVCNGAWAPELLKPAGIRLPIYPVKGYSLTFAKPKDLQIDLPITDYQYNTVLTTIGDKLRISGGFDFVGLNSSLPTRRIEHLIQNAQRIIPGLNVQSPTLRMGFRPFTPNSLPIVRSCHKYKNLHYNLGHGMLGWTLAHATSFRSAQGLLIKA